MSNKDTLISESRQVMTYNNTLQQAIIYHHTGNMRSSGVENCDKPGKVPEDIAMLPPIRKQFSPSSPDSEMGMRDFIPSIGISGYRDLRRQACRASSPPSRLGSMLSSTASSPTKLPSLDGSTRYSVTSLDSTRSFKLQGTRNAMCRSPSCPQLYSDFDEDPFPDGGDLNASIHPHMTRQVGQPTTLRLPEIFNAAENVPKFKHQASVAKNNTQWAKGNQLKSAKNESHYLDRKDGAGLKRQTISSVGSSLGSFPSGGSDIESPQHHSYGSNSNTVLLPLKESMRIRKKRKRSNNPEDKAKRNTDITVMGNGSSPRVEKNAHGNLPSLGKWDVRGDDYGSDGSIDSIDSDCDLTYDQDIAIDHIAMENKVKFGCMKSL